MAAPQTIAPRSSFYTAKTGGSVQSDAIFSSKCYTSGQNRLLRLGSLARCHCKYFRLLKETGTAVLSLTDGLIKAYKWDCAEVMASPPRLTTPDVTPVTPQGTNKRVSINRKVERSHYQLQHSYKNKEIRFLVCPANIQEHIFAKVLAVLIRSVRLPPSQCVLSNTVAFSC